MNAGDFRNDPALWTLVEGLREALGPRLKGIVLYGSAARGDYQASASDINVMVVLASLDPATLEAVSPAVRRFVRKGHTIPRLFSPGLIAASADSFPIEFVDIRAARVIIYGDDPFGTVQVARDNLRLQLEREIKEKMMRLREAYVLVHDRASALRRLLKGSYPAFAALFRGGLYLSGRPVPAHSQEVVAAFCDAAALDRAPFDELARLRRGEKTTQDLKAIFARYHDALTRAAEWVDRLNTRGGETR